MTNHRPDDRRARILIVEDEPAAALELADRLCRLGYTPLGPAGSADEALQMCGATRPDVVLMDIGLPGESDGVDAAGWIRSEHGLPVVFLTCFIDQEDFDRARRTGPVSYLTKPVKDSDLRAALTMALPGPGARDGALAVLTVRQAEIANELASGYRVNQIALRLHISEHTVRNHLKRIFDRLGVNSQVELVRLVLGVPR